MIQALTLPAAARGPLRGTAARPLRAPARRLLPWLERRLLELASSASARLQDLIAISGDSGSRWLEHRRPWRYAIAGAVLVLGPLCASGCGAWVSRGGGGYTILGPGSESFARRCSPNFDATHPRK